MSNASCAGRSQTSLSWQTSHRGWSRWALPSHQCLVEKGTFQVQKLSKCPRVKSCGYIVYQTRVFLHSAGIKLGDGTTIIFYTGQQKIRRATLKHWIFSPIIKFLSLDLLKAKKLSHHKTVSNKSIKPSENTRGLFCVKSGFLTVLTQYWGMSGVDRWTFYLPPWRWQSSCPSPSSCSRSPAGWCRRAAWPGSSRCGKRRSGTPWKPGALGKTGEMERENVQEVQHRGNELKHKDCSLLDVIPEEVRYWSSLVLKNNQLRAKPA